MAVTVTKGSPDTHVKISVANSNDAVAAQSQIIDLVKHGYSYISIQTGTLTASDVVLLASNDGTNFIDITNALFSSATLSASSYYDTGEVRVNALKLKLQWTPSNATNATNITLVASKGARV